MKIKKHAVSSMTGAYMESYEIISKNRHIGSADVPVLSKFFIKKFTKFYDNVQKYTIYQK